MASKGHCTEAGQLAAKVAISLFNEPGMGNFDNVFKRMRKLAPSLERAELVHAVMDAHRAEVKAQGRKVSQRAKIMHEVQIEEGVINRVEKLAEAWERGEAVARTPHVLKTLNEGINAARKARAEWEKKVRKRDSDAAQAKRLKGEAADIRGRVAEGDTSPLRQPGQPKQDAPNVAEARADRAAAVKELQDLRKQKAQAKAATKRAEKKAQADAEKRKKRIDELTRQNNALDKRIDRLTRGENLGPDLPGKPKPAPKSEGPDIEALKAKREGLKKEAEELEKADRAARREAKNKADELARLDADIASLEKWTKAGQGRPRTASPTPKTDADVAAKRAERDTLLSDNEAVKRLRELEDALISLRNGDDSKVLTYKPTPRLDKASDARRLTDIEIKEARAEVRAYLNDLDTPMWRKILRESNFDKALKASMELSTMGRQGALAGVVTPTGFVKSTAAGLNAFARGMVSTKSGKIAIDKINDRIRANPHFLELQRLGLKLPDQKLGISGQEEFLATRLMDKLGRLPGVGAVFRRFATSGEAAVAALNMLRVEAASKAYEGFGGKGFITDGEARALTKFVNDTTGRTSLGKFETAATDLNAIFFAPRWAWSRFVVLAEPLVVGFRSGKELPGKAQFTPRVKRWYLAQYAKYVGGVGALLGLANLMAEDGEEPVELDWRSSDFGKLKVGNTRMDFGAGLLQPIRFLGQMATAESKSLRTGQIRDQERTRTAANFLRSKSSPSVARLISYAPAILDGEPPEDFLGRQITIEGEIENAVIPLTYRDIWEIYEEAGIPRAVGLGSLLFLGVGGQTFDVNAPRPKNQPDESIIIRPMLDAMKGDDQPNRQIARR